MAAAEVAIKNCRATPSAYVPAPPWKASRPSSPPAMARGTPTPKVMNAETRSKPPANNPPTRIAGKAFGRCAGNAKEAAVMSPSRLGNKSEVVRGQSNGEAHEKNVNHELNSDDV